MNTTSTVTEGALPATRKARALGFHHVALEVGDIDEALAAAGIAPMPGTSLRFRDPRGNRSEIVSYD